MSQNPHQLPPALLAFGLLGGALLLNVLLYLGRPQPTPGPCDLMAELSLEQHLQQSRRLLQRARSLQAWSESDSSAELRQLRENAWSQLLDRVLEIDRPRPEAPLLETNVELQDIFAEARDQLYGPKSQRSADSLILEFKARAFEAQACTDRSRSSRESGAERDRQRMIRRAKQLWQRVFGLLTLLQSQKQYGDGQRFSEPLRALDGVLSRARKNLHDLTLEARPGDFESAKFNPR